MNASGLLDCQVLHVRAEQHVCRSAHPTEVL